MNVRTIVQYRLVNQQIAGTNCSSPEELVRTLGAMQAQEYSQSKWSIGLRLPHVIDADIENAFTKGQIIRTHILRPTWHFVSPQDIRWMLSLSAPRVRAANSFMYRKLELDNKIFRKTNNVLEKALECGKHLTRTKLAFELERKKIIADGFRLSYIMMHAELDGIICSGAREGKQFTYALLDERVASSKPMKNDEALAELTKRYFNSRGPATPKDFGIWSGLSLAQVKKGLGMVVNDFNHTKIDNTDYYFPSIPSNKILSKGISSKQNVHLLPVYDEYIMGYKDRNFYLNLKNKINPSPSFTFDSTIIIKGQIAGAWRRTINKNSIDLEYNLFKPLNKTDKKKFLLAVDHYSKFMGMLVILK